jgi:hypothetical protein
MPTKKAERENERAKPVEALAQQVRKSGPENDNVSGRSGQGAASVLAHMKEQESTQARKSGRG